MLARFLLFSLLVISNFATAKIASLDLCADQWLMTFAKPDQVAFLTPLSKDPAVSYHYEKSKTYSTDVPSVENLLSQNIDTVLTTGHISGSIKNILEKNGIQVIVIPPITNLDCLIKWAKKIKHLMHSNNEIILKLQSITKDSSLKHKALYIGAAGSSPGQETLVSKALSFAGFKNVNDFDGWGYNDIETIIVQNPTYIFTAKTLGGNLNSSGCVHYEKLTQSVIVSIPQRHTVCMCPESFINLIKVFKNAKK